MRIGKNDLRLLEVERHTIYEMVQLVSGMYLEHGFAGGIINKPVNRQSTRPSMSLARLLQTPPQPPV
jgi:hypothetical protein